MLTQHCTTVRPRRQSHRSCEQRLADLVYRQFTCDIRVQLMAAYAACRRAQHQHTRVGVMRNQVHAQHRALNVCAGPASAGHVVCSSVQAHNGTVAVDRCKHCGPWRQPHDTHKVVKTKPRAQRCRLVHAMERDCACAVTDNECITHGRVSRQLCGTASSRVGAPGGRVNL